MNILTFDIEEWFHILDNASTEGLEQWNRYEKRLDGNLDRILQLLDGREIKATFFCLGWVAREYPHLVRKIADAGFEIATHSDQHKLAYMQTPQEFREDLRKSIDSIQDITGVRVNSYRAPGFSLKAENSWVFDILIEEGIKVDSSIFPASRAHGGFPSFGREVPTLIKCESGELREFPINTYKVMGRHIIFSGGGYFRLLPYALLRYFAGRSQYLMTYFHPRDFDPGQPIIEDLSLLRRFKSYYGLGSSEVKLKSFIDDFSFISLEEANQLIDWDSAPVLEIQGTGTE